MVNLNTFRSVEHMSKQACEFCNSDGVFRFKKEDEKVDLCLNCFFTKASGKFKNMTQSELLKNYEEIEKVEVGQQRVSIETYSEFGVLYHVFYVDNIFSIRDSSGKSFDVVECYTLSGYSEIFGPKGNSLQAESPYSEIAFQAVSKRNSEILSQ